MKLTTTFRFAAALAAAGLAFETAQRTLGACAPGQSPADFPFVTYGSPYDGCLDVSSCSGACGGVCYLSTTVVIKYCRTIGGSESPWGCRPATVSFTGYQGACSPNSPNGSYPCGCTDFDPQPSPIQGNTAETCTP